MSAALVYPIAAVARMTGLTLDTIRAWERRYAAVVAERGPRGRVYTDAQVERLRRLAALVDHGHPISQVANLSDARLAQLLKKTAEGVSEARADGAAEADTVSTPSRVLQPVIEAIERYDYSAADREVGRLAAIMPPRALVYEVALPLMREVGRRWHAGELTVAQEHMLTGIVQSVTGALVRLHPVRSDAPRVLFACPEGELHEFGIRAAAMLAAAAGLEIVYLGASVPASDLASAALATGVSVLVLGVTGNSGRVRDELPVIRRALSPEVEMWVGGPAQAIRGTLPGRVLFLETFEQFEQELSRLVMHASGMRRERS